MSGLLLSACESRYSAGLLSRSQSHHIWLFTLTEASSTSYPYRFEAIVSLARSVLSTVDSESV